MTKRKKALICVISVLLIFGVVTGIYALCVNSYIKNREKDKIFTVDSVSGGYDCIVIQKRYRSAYFNVGRPWQD